MLTSELDVEDEADCLLVALEVFALLVVLLLLLLLLLDEDEAIGSRREDVDDEVPSVCEPTRDENRQ